MQNQINSMFGSIGQAIFRSKAINSMVEQKNIMEKQVEVTEAIRQDNIKSIEEAINRYYDAGNITNVVDHEVKNGTGRKFSDSDIAMAISEMNDLKMKIHNDLKAEEEKK